MKGKSNNRRLMCFLGPVGPSRWWAGSGTVPLLSGSSPRQLHVSLPSSVCASDVYHTERLTPPTLLSRGRTTFVKL